MTNGLKMVTDSWDNGYFRHLNTSLHYLCCICGLRFVARFLFELFYIKRQYNIPEWFESLYENNHNFRYSNKDDMALHIKLFHFYNEPYSCIYCNFKNASKFEVCGVYNNV